MKTINAFLYPTPEEFDRQMARLREARRSPLDLGTLIHQHLNDVLSPVAPSSFDEAMLRAIREAYDSSNQMSPEERIIRDAFAEAFGVPPEFLIVERMKDMLGSERAERFIPNAPDEFVWRSHDGTRYNVTDMATPHLFYSLRMIFNHTVAPIFRVLRPGETMRRYHDVPFWTEDYRRRAVDALTAELKERDDLSEELQDQFDDMQANASVILALGL